MSCNCLKTRASSTKELAAARVHAFFPLQSSALLQLWPQDEIRLADLNYDCGTHRVFDNLFQDIMQFVAKTMRIQRFFNSETVETIEETFQAFLQSLSMQHDTNSIAKLRSALRRAQKNYIIISLLKCMEHKMSRLAAKKQHNNKTRRGCTVLWTVSRLPERKHLAYFSIPFSHCCLIRIASMEKSQIPTMEREERDVLLSKHTRMLGWCCFNFSGKMFRYMECLRLVTFSGPVGGGH